MPANHRILVIDDNKEIHNDFKKIFERNGENENIDTLARELLGHAPSLDHSIDFSIDSAFQGEDALKLVRQAKEKDKPYALAFVDVRIPPGMDGVETIQQLKKIDQELQCVVITAHSDYSWEDITQKIGPTDWLLILKKPFETIEIRQLAHSLTEKWNLSRQGTVALAKLQLMNTELIGEIAQRQKVENTLREYQKAVESTQDLIAVVDSKYTYLLANHPFLELLEKEKEQVVDHTVSDVWGKEVFENTSKEQLDRCLQGEVVSAPMTFCFPRLGERALLASYYPVVGDNQKVSRVVTIIRDITELKQAEKEKAKLESLLRQSHKMEAICTMAGGIAHDFNNILAAIIGYADMAQGDIPEFSPAKQQIEQVLKAGNRAKDLVRHILTFSHMTPPAQDQALMSLSFAVKEVLKFQRSVIPTTIKIKSDIDENCGMIHGDPTQIHQVIMNFCTNGWHAMEEKGGTLEVGLQQTDLSVNDLERESNLQPGPYLQLSIRDTGTGIPPELIDKIFDPYFTTKEVGKGSGMGLAVVQGIVKNHGGFVKVTSKPNQGSTFSVFFPKIKDEIILESPSAPEDMPTGTEKILFVDDEKMLADLGKARLERLGYTVTSLTDSVQALNLVQTDPTRFDLVITDQTMPNLPGSELAKKLLQIRPDLPIILCTGYSSILGEQESKLIGIREHILKPVQKDVLAQLIRKVLAKT